MKCLNEKNPQVKAAIDEIEAVLGSHDAAYYIVSENEGYAIDQAPNGEPSKLFSDLLEHFNGDRQQAIRAKTKIYTDGFKSDHVKPGDIIYGHPAIGKTYSFEKGKFADKFIDWDVEFNRKRDEWIEQHSGAKKGTKKYKNARREYLTYPEKYPDYTEFITSEWNKAKEKAVRENKILFASPISLLRMFPQDFTKVINLSTEDFVQRSIERGEDAENAEDWKNNINSTIDAITDIPVITFQKGQYLEDYLSKAAAIDVNGEPVIDALQLSEPEKYSTEEGAFNIESLKDTKEDLDIREQEAAENLEHLLGYTEEDQQSFEEVTKDLSNTILENLQSRLVVYYNPDPVLKEQVTRSMQWQIQNITQGLASDYANVSNFLKEIMSEVKEISEFLVEARKNNKVIDDAKLNDLDQNFFSFYSKAVDDIVASLMHREAYREIVGKNSKGEYKLDKLVERAKRIQAMLIEGQAIVKTKIAENASAILNQVGMEVGAPVIYKYNQSNPSPDDQDISFLTAWLGAGDKIKDTSVKTIFYLINKADEKTRKDKYKVMEELEDLLTKAGKHNQYKLFEVDDNGNTTGYLVRSRNYGKFENAYKAEMDKICMELGIDVTQLSLPENRGIRIEYNKRRNKWLSKHCERRFTAKYYEAFNHLSEETQQQREAIQTYIRNLQNKARDQHGIVRLDRLSEKERQELKGHILRKKQLASLYDASGRMKQGTELKIAQELQELNKKLSQGFVMTKNSDKFEQEKARVMADPNLTPEQKQQWIEYNTRTTYKQEFYDKLKKLERKYYGKDYEALSERRRALLNMFRDDVTGEIDNLPLVTKNALKAITREMNRIRKSKKATTIEGENVFEDIADVVPTKKWYDDKRKFYDLVVVEDPEAAELWLKENAYTIKQTTNDGRTIIKTVPKSWYTKVVPKDKSMIEVVPNNNWLEVSEKSEFYNKAYYQAQQDHPELAGEYWIPKKELYDSSEQYSKIQSKPELKALYDGVFRVMNEATDKLTNLNKTQPYRLPQMSGSIYKYIGAEWRARKGFDKFNALPKGIFAYWRDKLSVRNDDKGFNKAFTKPNGERLNLIPQNYIHKLDNPAYLTADLVGSVIEYYESCTRWSYNREIQPKIELLKSYISGKKYKNKKGETKKSSNIKTFVDKFIDMNLYDIKNQNVTVSYGDNPSGKMFGILPYKGNIFGFIPYDISKPREINITKMLSILRTLGTTRNLALNVYCSLTGGFTALYSHIVNSLTARYYNPIDAAVALKDMMIDMLVNVPNKFGVTTYKPFMSRCMEYFEVGAELRPHPTNRVTILNMLTKHWGFGIYTLQDHFIKGQILGSVMHNYKLITDKDGKKRFVSREEYKTMNKLSVYTPGDALDWNFGDKLSFRDAVHFVGGELRAIDPANQQAVEEVQEQIGYLARSLAQSADGQLTNLQRSALLSHCAGQFGMMHRQYLPVILQERYTMSRQYDYQTQRWKEAVFRTPIRLITEAIKNNENLIDKFKYEINNDPVVRENLAKIVYEAALWIILAKIIRPLLASSADDDKKNILKQILAYAIDRTTFETLAPYNLADMARVIKSPSAITSYVEGLFELFYSPFDMLYDTVKSEITGENINKAIRKGAYKGMTPFTRDLIKLTPFKNIIELKDTDSKRRYYQNQILKE